MPRQPNNTFLKSLLRCSIEHVNANSKWQEEDKDTEWFQNEIYVSTKLDRELLRDLLDVKYQLVFLSGTPGSGKTQFLKMLKNGLLKRGYKSASSIPSVRTSEVLDSNGKIIIAEREAREARKGMWAQGMGYVSPRDWRRERGSGDFLAISP